MTFQERLRAPFRRLTEPMTRLQDAAEAARGDCAEEVAAWPELAAHTRKETLPAWEERIGRMDEHMRPVDLRALYAERRRLNTLNRLSWRLPSALRIRALNLLYRTGIASVRLLQAAAILALLGALLWIMWKLA